MMRFTSHLLHEKKLEVKKIKKTETKKGISRVRKKYFFTFVFLMLLFFAALYLEFKNARFLCLISINFALLWF